MNPTPTEILEAIQTLSPGQRRQLFRRLRAIGLLDTGGPWADLDRLSIAPAVRRQAVDRPTADESARQKRREAALNADPQRGPAILHTHKTAQVEPIDELEDDSDAYGPDAYGPDAYADDDAPYQSSVRSKVILGAPGATTERSLEIMEPVPGQAPEAPIRIIFDGGSRGNPGKGYGSYALDWPGLPRQKVQLRFGDRVTNNEAEYDTLISALEATIKKLEDGGAGPEAAQVEILGDSLLVVNQVLGEWEVKNPRMRTRCERVKYLLGQFGRWHLAHHGRENSVRVLGH